ncbi:MAG: hypothetical protein Q4D33_09615 [Prevotellaceae bacterium]|nr:hypothetical protein [Prevotellaceae bacterium]
MNNTQKEPGMNCPQCGNFIRTSIVELLSATGLKCHHCGLVLTINRNESKRAMDLLREVNDAKNNLDRASKF